MRFVLCSVLMLAAAFTEAARAEEEVEVPQPQAVQRVYALNAGDVMRAQGLRLLKEVEQTLDDAAWTADGVPFSWFDVAVIRGGSVQVRLGKPAETQELVARLQEILPHTKVTHDDFGTVFLTYGHQARDEFLDFATQQTLELIYQRLRNGGYNEQIVERLGIGGVSLSVPPSMDALPLLPLLESRGVMEIVPELSDDDPFLALRNGLPPQARIVYGAGWPMRISQRKPYLLADKALVTSHNLKKADVVEWGSGYSVQLQLDDVGASWLAEYTQRNVGKRLAVMVDGQIYAMPEIAQPLYSGIVTLPLELTRPAAQSLAHVLYYGPLPAQVSLIE